MLGNIAFSLCILCDVTNKERVFVICQIVSVLEYSHRPFQGRTHYSAQTTSKFQNFPPLHKNSLESPVSTTLNIAMFLFLTQLWYDLMFSTEWHHCMEYCSKSAVYHWWLATSFPYWRNFSSATVGALQAGETKTGKTENACGRITRRDQVIAKRHTSSNIDDFAKTVSTLYLIILWNFADVWTRQEYMCCSRACCR